MIVASGIGGLGEATVKRFEVKIIRHVLATLFSFLNNWLGAPESPKILTKISYASFGRIHFLTNLADGIIKGSMLLRV